MIVMRKAMVIIVMMLMLNFTVKSAEAFVITVPSALVAVGTLTWQAVFATATLAVVGGIAFAVAEDGTKIVLEKIREGLYRDANGNQYRVKRTIFGKKKLERVN